MNGGILQVLTAPRTFFEREGDDPSVRGPVLVVVLLAVLGALTQVVTFTETGHAFEGEIRDLLVVFQVFSAVIAVAVPFVVWLLYALAFFVVSMFLDGEGTFREVALLTAWGFLPRVFDAAISSVATVVAYRDTEVSDLSSPEAFMEFAGQVASHPANRAATVAGIALLFWSAYIWVPALQESRRLDRGEAVVTVAIPVAIALLWRLYGLLGTF